MSVPFVDGWSIAQVLGEGAFGEVKLLVNNETREAVAVKVLNTASNQEAQLSVRKEIAVHRSLNHPHIVRYFGHRREDSLDYIFLEYASGGELFDRIEPDVGMDEPSAQRYFLELVSAVDYLHTLGVTHRDIKPENILLSETDQIKLSDFGMATMFRRAGIERLLDKKCGTMPYVAPEVLLRPYSAPCADVWSCGIVLVAMLAGELPWDTPSKECAEFVSWRDGNLTSSPWCKLATPVLSLIRKILSPLPAKRPTAAAIPTLRWCKTATKSARRSANGPPAKRVNSGSHEALTSPVRTSLTQPVLAVADSPRLHHLTDDDSLSFSFSQPVVLDDLLLSSQLHATQTVSAPVYQRLVKRMTRLWVKPPADEAHSRLTAILEDLSCSVKSGPQHVLTVTGTDRRKMQFTSKVNLLPMDERVLLDFRLSKGDGLEFKKLFIRIKEAMGDAVIKKPVPWTDD